MSWLKPKVLLLKKSHNISKHYWRHDAKIICAKECNVLIWIITKEIMHFLSTCENGVEDYLNEMFDGVLRT
jgi:hypothetical protein